MPDSTLQLYHHPLCYYCQKVLMVLHEKDLKFDTRFVNLAKGEQYESWFLHLNPKGEVPVLVHEKENIITDSTCIIQYLEEKFTTDKLPKLTSSDAQINENIKKYCTIIDTLPVVSLMYGSFFHPDLVTNPKLPFISPVRNMLKNSATNAGKDLREHARKHPEFKSILLKKAEEQEQRYNMMINKESFIELLKNVEDQLDEIEKKLSNRAKDQQEWWLVSENFSLADVSLAIFLTRMDQIGFSSRFWIQANKPHLKNYFERIQKRKSYQNTFPSITQYILLFLLPYIPQLRSFIL